MSAKTAEDFCNTETEEGTIAIQRKRSRRVSFAEITSVHVFDRDDEYETPPEPKPSSDDPESSAQSNEGGLEFLRCYGDDSSQNDEKQEENDEDDLDGRRSFFQPFDSPSPGSTIGSATSNDEDNFFGPVSASFIRPGRLSDSAASDENHDITMDSTAFSMHFRSLARSDLGGDLVTPTGVHLSFEEKTPTQNTLYTNVGSSMVLTVAKPISEPSTSVDKLSGSTYSNDMSLVGQGPQRYDYGRLSPGLDALLAEGSKDLHDVSVSDNIPISKPIINLKSRFLPSKKDSEPIEPNDGRKEEMGTIDTADLQAEVVTFADKKLDEANGGYNISPVGQITYGVLSDMRNTPASDVSVDKSHNQLIKGLMSRAVKDSDTLEIRRSNSDFDAAICGIPSNLDNNAQETDAAAPSGYVSPPILSMSSLSDKQRLMVLNNASPSQNLQITAPFQSQPSSFGLMSGAIKDSDVLEIRRLNSDFDAAICGTPSKLDNKTQQTDTSAPSGYVSPSALSMSSLSAKHRLMILNNASQSQNLQITTPFQNQRSSFVRDLTRKQSEIESSIQKSISKLKMLNASPFSSALKVKNDSTPIPLDIFKTTMYNTVLDRDIEDVQIKCVDTSVACSEDQLFVGATENGELKSLIKMDISDIESSENDLDASHARSSTDVAEAGTFPGHMSSGSLLKLKEEEGLLSQITWPGNNTQENLSTPGDLIEGMVFTSAGDSLMEIMLDHANNNKTTGTPHGTLPSSVKNMEKTSLVSIHHGGSFSRDRRLCDQISRIAKLDQGCDADLREKFKNASPFATNKLDFLLLDRTLSSSPIMEINYSKESNGLDTMDGIGVVGNFHTPLINKETKKMHSMIVNGNVDIQADPVFSHGSASPFVHRGSIELHNKKPVMDLVTQSPSRKEHPNATHKDRLHSFVVEEMLSPMTDSFGNFHVRKRRREDAIHGDSLLLDEIARIRRSHDHHRYEINSKSLSERPSESNTETSTAVHEERLEHWADVFSKFLADAKQLFPSSTDKLTLQAIGELEDVLVNLRRVQIYDMLCMEIRSQKLSQSLSNFDYRRIEMKQLLHRFVHEQAKLQLMLMKRERLMKQLQLLGSGIQESQMLKWDFLPRLSTPCARDSCVDKSHCQSFYFEGIHEEEVAGKKVAALRQVLYDLEGKVTSLSQSFLDFCEKKGQPNHANTIIFVNDFLKKKACCRFIRLDMQLWDVDNLEIGNDHHNIVLNYAGFIIQRFTINVGPVSSIIISNKLHDAIILKRFPYMDVCTAFAFVLNANTTRKYVGSLSLIQETQTTGSVLGNLLDVAEELQAASVELQNMTHTNFHSPSVEQLELDLHFTDFKSGRKAALSLDMSCLKWGIYPSDAIPAIPYPLEGPPDMSQKSLPQQHLAEIRAAVQSLRVGYSRIIRLCRCVSELVQARSG